mmetsp:Transcript_2152/g.4817  ORF Transcript_2152/g.4817 Transcript_2152/m.4817 type:complete len:218 (-) Transcript_2152:134-787(-)
MVPSLTHHSHLTHTSLKTHLYLTHTSSISSSIRLASSSTTTVYPALAPPLSNTPQLSAAITAADTIARLAKMENMATSASAADTPGATRTDPTTAGTIVADRLMKHAAMPAPSDIRCAGQYLGNTAHISWLHTAYAKPRHMTAATGLPPAASAACDAAISTAHTANAFCNTLSPNPNLSTTMPTGIDSTHSNPSGTTIKVSASATVYPCERCKKPEP